jgi:hypothetical protein
MAAIPNPNPMIMLQMPLETFNQVQRILAKRKFSQTADIILNSVSRSASRSNSSGGSRKGAGRCSGYVRCRKRPWRPTRTAPDDLSLAL